VSRRHVQRERRRTEKALDEAFIALENGEPLLALRIGRRAREAGSMNPRILLDFAELAAVCGERREAEDTLRALLAATPGFAAAHAALAELLWGMGRQRAAVQELERAVELLPGDARAVARLQEWRNQLGEVPSDPEPAETPPPCALLEHCDVTALGDAFADTGAALVERLVAPTDVQRLLASYREPGAEFDREDGWASGVRGRYFRELPQWLAALRDDAYQLAVGVASSGLGRLGSGRGGDLPATLSAWRRREPQFASPRPHLRVLCCEPGGWLTGPVVDRGAFPLRLLVDLGPGPDPVSSLRLADRRPGRKVRERAFQTRSGDALLFPARERLDRVGGVFGLQAIGWSIGAAEGPRWLLDLPFDDG
jgi:hypothetical protein